MEEGSKFFFHTACEIERGQNAVQIKFEENIPPIYRHITTIGLNPQKISILRSKELGYLSKFTKKKCRIGELIQLDERDDRYKIAKLILKNVDMLLHSDGMTISLDDSVIRASVRCYICIDHKKTEEHTLFLECYAV